MAFVPYINDISKWKNNSREEAEKKFYPIQKGRGTTSNIQLLTPEESIINRAKAKLKSQINRSPRKKRLQSSTSSPRGNIQKKKRKLTKNQKGKGPRKIKSKSRKSQPQKKKKKKKPIKRKR